MAEASNALCAFYRALLNFLKANGKRIVSMCEISDQKVVKIEFYGLKRHFEECCGYKKLSEVLSRLNMEGHGIEMEVDEVKALVSLIDEMGVEELFLLLCNKTSTSINGMVSNEKQLSKYMLDNSLGRRPTNKPLKL